MSFVVAVRLGHAEALGSCQSREKAKPIKKVVESGALARLVARDGNTWFGGQKKTGATVQVSGGFLFAMKLLG